MNGPVGLVIALIALYFVGRWMYRNAGATNPARDRIVGELSPRKFYQTRWFTLLCGLIVLSIFLASLYWLGNANRPQWKESELKEVDVFALLLRRMQTFALRSEEFPLQACVDSLTQFVEESESISDSALIRLDPELLRMVRDYLIPSMKLTIRGINEQDENALERGHALAAKFDEWHKRNARLMDRLMKR